MIKTLKEMESESDSWKNSQFKFPKAGVHWPRVENMRKTNRAEVE